MCEADSFGSQTGFISLQIHAECRTSISPSAANKTPSALDPPIYRENVCVSAVVEGGGGVFFPSPADKATASPILLPGAGQAQRAAP